MLAYSCKNMLLIIETKRRFGTLLAFEIIRKKKKYAQHKVIKPPALWFIKLLQFSKNVVRP